MKAPKLKTVVVGGVISGLLLPAALFAFLQINEERGRRLAAAAAEQERMLEIVAIGVGEPLWDLNTETATPLIASVVANPSVTRVVVANNRGETFVELAQPTHESGTVVQSEKPIMRDGAVIGTVTLRYALGLTEQAIAAQLAQIIRTVAVQLLVSLAFVWFIISSRVLTRISAIQREAEALARKELDKPFVWAPGDEIASLGLALESTRGALKSLFAELESKNAEMREVNARLEIRVQERTSTIKTILDNVRSGFLLVSPALVVEPGFSRSCVELLETEHIDGYPLPALLRLTPQQAEHFRFAVTQVFEDFLPVDVALTQVPNRFQIGNRSHSIVGNAVRDAAGKICLILFTILDVTKLERAERDAKTNRTLIRILQNVDAFQTFLAESRAGFQDALRGLAGGDETRVRGILHTLKGNSAAFGLVTVADHVQKVEELTPIEVADINAVEATLNSFLDLHHDVLKVSYDGTTNETYAVGKDAFARLIGLTAQTLQAPALADAVRQWAHSEQRRPARTLLGPLLDYAESAAIQQGKLITFVVRGGDVSVNPTVMRPVVQNLVHLVRNAIYHGIELPTERGKKPPQATIVIEFLDCDGTWEVSVSDDGRGIPTQKLTAKAVQLGLKNEAEVAAMTQAEAVELIFLNSMSTADAVSDFSGRGVGMGAVKAAVQTVGGAISVSSEVGRGTRFKLTVPKLLAAAKLAA